MLDGEDADIIFVKGKALQDGQLGALGIETPIVDHSVAPHSRAARSLRCEPLSAPQAASHSHPPVLKGRFRMLQVRGVVLCTMPPSRVRRLQEVDGAVPLIKTTVHTRTASVLHQCSKERPDSGRRRSPSSRRWPPGAAYCSPARRPRRPNEEETATHPPSTSRTKRSWPYCEAM